MKTLMNSETFTERHIRILLRLAISVMGRFPPHLMGGLWKGTIFRITAGFQNKFYSNRWVCRNKLFEESYWKDF